jgi:hypothetical protein
MSAITDLIGGIVSGLGKTAIDVRTAITGVDASKAAELQQLAMNIDAQAMQAQASVNQIEAANTNLFVSGWRPAIGWLCGFAFALNYIVYPILNWGLAIAKVTLTPVLPQMDITTMMPVLLGLLGLGTMRTIEKANGTQGNH